MFSYVMIKDSIGSKTEVKKEVSPAATPTPPPKTVKVGVKASPKVDDYSYSHWDKVHQPLLLQLSQWLTSNIGVTGKEFLAKSKALSLAVTTNFSPRVSAHKHSADVGHYLDAKFADYEVAANFIGKHHYIATTGRYSHRGTAEMYAHLPFNMKMSAPPSIFLRLGRCEAGTHDNRTTNHDFCDYALNYTYRTDDDIFTVRDASTEDATDSQSSEHIPPPPVIRDAYTTTRVKVTQGSTKITKELMVQDLAIEDNWIFDTPEDLAFQQWFYTNIYKPSENQNIVIHCSAGLGRTGYVIFALLILDHFDAIFFDPHKQPHEQLIKLFAYERTFRSAAIATIFQFFGAIQLAIHLRSYEDGLKPTDRKNRVEGRNIPTFADIEELTNPLVRLVIVNGHTVENAVKIYKAGSAAVAGNPAPTGLAEAAAAHGIHAHANGPAVGADDGKSEAAKPTVSAAPKGALMQG